MNERERQLIYDALCEVLFYAEDNGGYYQCNYSVDEIKKLADKYNRQEEIDLDKEIDEKAMKLHIAPTFDELDKYARYFYELGRRAER